VDSFGIPSSASEGSHYPIPELSKTKILNLGVFRSKQEKFKRLKEFKWFQKFRQLFQPIQPFQPFQLYIY
jgi:hypothetical protein